MSGRGHEQVPGGDAMPLIEVVSVLVVRGWKGIPVLSRTYKDHDAAVEAEKSLRFDLANAPAGDVVAVLTRWKDEGDDMPMWEVG